MVALVWLPFEITTVAMPNVTILAWILGVAGLAILIPLLLFQLAVRRTDGVTFMVCVAAQPVLSFLLSIPSPAYTWDLFTLAGVSAVTLFVGLDIFASYRQSLVPAPVALEVPVDEPPSAEAPVVSEVRARAA